LSGITDDPIRNGINGFLVPVGKINAYAEALKELYNVTRSEKMSKAAWEITKSRYSEERMVGDYCTLIEDIRAKGYKRNRTHFVERELLGRWYWIPSGIKIMWSKVINRKLSRSV
jgi:hypothetical protein